MGSQCSALLAPSLSGHPAPSLVADECLSLCPPCLPQVLVISDVHARHTAPQSGAGPQPLFGDLLTLAGASLYATSNVAQEYLLGHVVGPVEVLAGLGMWAAGISALQVWLLEWDALQETSFVPAVAGPFAAFFLALFVFYSLVPLMLRHAGAAMLSLSLLSSDLWVTAARASWFGGFGGGKDLGWFALSLLCVVGGIGLYATSGEIYVGEGPKYQTLEVDAERRGNADEMVEAPHAASRRQRQER